MGIRLANKEITLTLNPAQATMIAAALKVFGHLAEGGDDDPDTDATAEAFEAYLVVMRQVYGGDMLMHSPADSAEVRTLATQLERDMLTIVHRNYRRTKDALVRKDSR